MSIAEDDYAAIADLYDHVVPYRTRQDVRFFVEAAEASGGPVLEIGCGTGRVLIPTARAGVEITGLDLSPEMLGVCERTLQAEPDAVRSRVRLVRADMRDFDLERSFRLITLPFRPFQHLTTVPDQLACLQSIHRHLDDDGRLVFDLFNPKLESLVSDDLGEVFQEEPEFTAPDGRRVVRRLRLVERNLFDQLITAELIYSITHIDQRQESIVQRAILRYSFRWEIEHLLARSGFQVESVYADYDKSPFGSKYPGDLIVVARKARYFSAH